MIRNQTALADRPALVLGLATLALHLAFNGGYDYFRDELYFIACGNHPAWGYVDQPPLAPLIARLERLMLGDSLLGLRLVPAVTAAGLVALSTEAARRLGGGRFARWLAGLAVLVAPDFSIGGLLLSTDTLQPISWLAMTLAILEAIEHDRPRAWLLAGALAGLSALDKYMVAFFLAAVLAGLLATPRRQALARPAPWLGIALMLVILAPNLLWQQNHGWPFLALGAVTAGGKNLAYGPLAYLGEEIRMLNPLTAPIWLAGLWHFGARPTPADRRWIAVAWVALMAMMLAIHGKPYYPAGIYPILLAGGSVALEKMLRPRWAQGAALAALAVSGLAILPFALPVLPIERFIAYQQTLGIGPETNERGRIGILPQYYADMFGWREMAAAVGRAYQALPPEDQARAVFLAGNYGEAGAIDFFGAPWQLPPAISGHNNYFLWGPRGHDGSVVLRIGRTREDLLKSYASVEAVGRIEHPYAMPYETGLTLWLCRDRQVPLAADWATFKHYD
jgi:4-amino-4-deoxy-L-arabinose transferase-like glycosyltransferase